MEVAGSKISKTYKTVLRDFLKLPRERGWGGGAGCGEHRIFQGPVGGKRLQDRTVSITLLT